MVQSQHTVESKMWHFKILKSKVTRHFALGINFDNVSEEPSTFNKVLSHPMETGSDSKHFKESSKMTIEHKEILPEKWNQNIILLKAQINCTTTSSLTGVVLVSDHLFVVNFYF